MKRTEQTTLNTIDATRLDLTNIMQIIGDDEALMGLLFREFETSFERHLKALDAHKTKNSEWSSAMHLLKGLALNLGAVKLSELCTEANHETLQKSIIIGRIDDEYSYVIECLNNIL
jgi:HPt (histidine-containing phosphotransfer) domain-containing protein